MMLLEKITELKNKFLNRKGDSQDIDIIDNWYNEAKRLFLIQNLKGHDGIKYVLEIFGGEVKKINSQLNNSYSKDLSDKDRDRLLDKRDLAQKYLDLFDGVDKDLEKLDEIVDMEDIK